MNKTTGLPIMGPVGEKFGVFNPEAVVVAAGNVDHSNCRMDEAAIYRIESDGSISLSSQFALARRPSRPAQWPVNNWMKSILSSEKKSGVYFSSLDMAKEKAFAEMQGEDIVNSLSESEHIALPSLGWLYLANMGDRNISMSVERLKAIMKSRVSGIIATAKRIGKIDRQDEKNRLVIKFRNMLDIVQHGVNDSTLSGFICQFCERFEELDMEAAQGLMYGIHAICGKRYRSQIEMGIKDGIFGDPDTDGHIMPVVWGSPIFIKEEASSLIWHDKGFNRFPYQEDLHNACI